MIDRVPNFQKVWNSVSNVKGNVPKSVILRRNNTRATTANRGTNILTEPTQARPCE